MLLPKCKWILLVLLVLTLAESATAGEGTVKVSLVDKETGEPVIGAPIWVDGKDPPIIADENGRFELTGIKAGEHYIEIKDPEHHPFRASFTMEAGQIVELDYALEPLGKLEHETVVIREKRLKAEVSDKVLEIEEVKKIPGTQGDVVKIVQSMPGVARNLAMTGGSSSGLVIRGAAPEDSRVLIDGHMVPLLYHFGGLKSVLNSDMLKRIDYMPGGFGVENGEVIGGIVDVQTRSCDDKKFNGYLELSLLDAGFMLSGPLGSDAGFMAAARRSTIDLWLPEVIPDDSGFELTVAPVYYDYQTKVDYSPNKANRLSVFVYGSSDEMKFLLEQPPSGDPSIRGDFSMVISFHRLLLSWVHAPNSVWSVSASVVGGYDNVSFIVGEDRYFKINVPNLAGRIDYELEISDQWKFKTGLSSWVSFFDYTFRMPRIPKEGQIPNRFAVLELFEGSEETTAGGASAYLLTEYQPIDDLLIVLGLRLEEYGQPIHEFVALPRLALKYEPWKGTLFKGAVGLYYQAAQPDEMSPFSGNPDLGLEKAWHFTIGWEQTLPAKFDLEVELFYKDVKDLIVPDENSGYLNQGIGIIYGLEVLLRKELSDNLFGWIAYTLMHSQRKDGPGEAWRLFDFDQTHILTFVAGYQLPTSEIEPAHGLRDGWDFGLRFQLVSGNPDTPILGGVFDADYDTYLPLPGAINSDRLPLYHRLDLRVDYTWAFTAWALSVFLDVQNVYDYRSIEGVRYNYDFTERSYFEGLPILPFLGLKGSF
jgi:outer membrane receptor protein involved in Fe transport